MPSSDANLKRSGPRPSMAGPAPLGRIPGRNVLKADGIPWATAGGRLFFKDYRRRPAWVRWTIGRYLLAREARALRVTSAIDGVPHLLGRPHPDCLVLQWVPGEPAGDWPADVDANEAGRRLVQILEALHAAGVAIGDLHRSDVLVGPEGEVHVVDLATAVVCAPGASARRRRWFERWCERDRVAAARIVARWTGRDPIAAIEEAAGPEAVARWRRRRRLKRRWNALRGRS